MTRLATTVTLALLLTAASAPAQFADTGQVNAAYDRDDPALVIWASSVVEIQRGPIDHADPDGELASHGEPTDLLGPDGTAVSLGDHGWITVGFDEPLADGPGDDLVVFENGFAAGGLVYAEMAFVEVSTDGETFARLPALCRNGEPTGSYDAVDPALYYNLAGNHVGGTAYDLQDLMVAGDPAVISGEVDLLAIRYVRLVDVIGDLGPGGTVDHLGRPVSDPYPTAFASGGFDATGVAGINLQSVRTERQSWTAVKSLFD
ncbi:hypothetical protein GF314_12450 [bacterium]|nr:hypothetical protein [bacterium]